MLVVKKFSNISCLIYIICYGIEGQEPELAHRWSSRRESCAFALFFAIYFSIYVDGSMPPSVRRFSRPPWGLSPDPFDFAVYYPRTSFRWVPLATLEAVRFATPQGCKLSPQAVRFSHHLEDLAFYYLFTLFRYVEARRLPSVTRRGDRNRRCTTCRWNSAHGRNKTREFKSDTVCVCVCSGGIRRILAQVTLDIPTSEISSAFFPLSRVVIARFGSLQFDKLIPACVSIRRIETVHIVWWSRTNQTY